MGYCGGRTHVHKERYVYAGTAVLTELDSQLIAAVKHTWHFMLIDCISHLSPVAIPSLHSKYYGPIIFGS